MFIAFICNCKIQKTTQVSYMEYMEKQTVVHLYNGMLLSSKKEWTFDTHNIPGYGADWKEPTSKVSYCVIPFIEHSWRNKIIMMETRSVVAKS